LAITGGGSITSFAGNVAGIASSLSGQSSLNVRDMTVSAKSDNTKQGCNNLFGCCVPAFLRFGRFYRSMPDNAHMGENLYYKGALFKENTACTGFAVGR
jgi:hypothetical protein